MSMDLDFLDIHQISQNYLRNTVMVLTRDIPSLENIQDNMPFSDEDDTTTAYPTYLPVPALVAKKITITMAMGGGKWIDTANLRSDVPDDAGDGDSSSDNDSGYGGGDGDGDGSEAGSVESEGSTGSEGSAASDDSYSSQGSQTSVSSAGSGHNSDNNEEEDSDDEENDWDDDDDDDDPYGEVEDDDFEFD